MGDREGDEEVGTAGPDSPQTAWQPAEEGNFPTSFLDTPGIVPLLPEYKHYIVAVNWGLLLPYRYTGKPTHWEMRPPLLRM